MILNENWFLKDIKSLQANYNKLTGIQALKRIYIKKAKPRGGSNFDWKIESFKHCRFDAGQEEYESFLKRGKRHHLEVNNLQVHQRGLSANKKKDVKQLLIKQFGEQWSDLPKLSWYQQILATNSSTALEYDEAIQIDDDDDNVCTCIEPDVGVLRV